MQFFDDRLPSRFWDKVSPEPMSGCWLWTGAITSGGYGSAGGGPRVARWGAYAHRMAYQALIGPIPQGLQLDHKCRIRSCCNPDHLEPVTNRENTIRGLAPKINSERLRAQHRAKKGHA